MSREARPVGGPIREGGELRDRSFPRDFLWGVAVSAHQVEGGSVDSWTAWEDAGRVPEKAGIACDWWRDAERDLDLAAALGLNALRLSTAWARVEPEEGSFDDKALHRYHEIAQGMIDRGIRPMVCLHHFADPVWFARRGAFTSPGAVDLFARYAARVADALGDVCDMWLTFNEPSAYLARGWLTGEYPPGERGNIVAAGIGLGNIARAHAAAYRVLHARIQDASVSWVQHQHTLVPASHRVVDRVAARVQDRHINAAFPHFVRTGRSFPELRVFTGDVSAVQGTADFLGISHCGRWRVRFDRRAAAEGFAHHYAPSGARTGDGSPDPLHGECDPDGIESVARLLAKWGKPVYVLEHGVADAADRIRPWLVVEAVRCCHELIEDGVDLRGYFHATLVDAFEWERGWSTRCGLVALDRATQQRAVRESGRLYGAIASAGALTADQQSRHARCGGPAQTGRVAVSMS
ncbi:MAG: glycoside hydrolase family 1 protein [Acidimicrobiia bacterium]|nr:glycoside hydrolase family 1 protein [Acidimicrobiia bacterium]